jgi:hypothetical protein
MKRPYILFLALTLAAALAAPNLEAGVGIKGGYSSAKFTLTPSEGLPFTNDRLPYFAGGLSFESGLGFFSLETDILYVRMGSTYVISADSVTENWLHYIQVPVLLKIKLMPGPVRPFLCGGGYGAYLIKAEGVMTEAGSTTKADLSDNFEKLDFGLAGGAGLTFRLPGIGLTVEGRYAHGLMNIDKMPAPGESTKNTCWMVLAGISF